MANEKYRAYLKMTGFRQWRLAQILGTSEGTLVRILREELPEYVQDGFINVIKGEIMQIDYDTSFYDKWLRERAEKARSKIRAAHHRTWDDRA